jgi:hypothetical protein
LICQASALEIVETEDSLSTGTAKTQTVWAPSETIDYSSVMNPDAADPVQPFLVDDVTKAFPADQFEIPHRQHPLCPLFASK